MDPRNTILNFIKIIIVLAREQRNKARIAAAKKIVKKNTKPYRLNIGCGKSYFDGWLNIDLDEKGPADINIDVRWPLPFEENSCELIFTEHTLEHLTVEHGVGFLRECFRILNKGGILRIAIPSLDKLIQRSYEGNWRDADWLSWPEYKHVSTRAEMINLAFRSWGHQWLYDQEELYRRLREAGFAEITSCEWGRSRLIDLCGRETRKDSLLIVEAEK